MGLILAALTIGSIAFVVGRGEQIRNDAAASKLAEQEAADKKAKEAEETAKNTPPATNPTPTPTTSTPVVSQTDTEALPTTGADLDVARVLVAAIFVGTLTAFITSRRTLKRSL